MIARQVMTELLEIEGLHHQVFALVDFDSDHLGLTDLNRPKTQNEAGFVFETGL